MTDEDWAAWEDSEAGAEQRRLDRVRVHGYTIAVSERVRFLQSELERRVTLLERARVDAERALEALRTELDHAETMARIVIDADPEVFERVARALEELEGES